MKLRDRIRELRRVPAGSLRPNPKNWRTHPKAQQDALRGVLTEVGIADALLARELEDGSLMLIDGHLRADVDPATEWPVLILDLSEAEADKVLLTLDPLAAMAESNKEQLDSLLREVDTGSEALQKMLSELAADAGLYEGGEAGGAAAGNNKQIPESFQVVIECCDEAEQKQIYDRMKQEGKKCRVLTV